MLTAMTQVPRVLWGRKGSIVESDPGLAQLLGERSSTAFREQEAVWPGGDPV